MDELSFTEEEKKKIQRSLIYWWNIDDCFSTIEEEIKFTELLEEQFLVMLCYISLIVSTNLSFKANFIEEIKREGMEEIIRLITEDLKNAISKKALKKQVESFLLILKSCENIEDMTESIKLVKSNNEKKIGEKV